MSASPRSDSSGGRIEDVEAMASWYDGGGASCSGSISKRSRCASSLLVRLLSVLPTLTDRCLGSSTWRDVTSYPDTARDTDEVVERLTVVRDVNRDDRESMDFEDNLEANDVRSMV